MGEKLIIVCTTAAAVIVVPPIVAAGIWRGHGDDYEANRIFSMATSTDMRLTSPAFADNRPIPSEYTCDGAEASPPLDISGVPAGARSLVLIAAMNGCVLGTAELVGTYERR